MTINLEFKDRKHSEPQNGDLCLCKVPEYTQDKFVVARYNKYQFITPCNQDITSYVEEFAVINY